MGLVRQTYSEERTRDVEMVDRRQFLQGSLLTAATMGVVAQEHAGYAEDDALTEAGPIIDSQVYLSRWPFRRIPGDEDTSALVELLRGHGVVQAWTGSFDGVFRLFRSQVQKAWWTVSRAR